MTDAWTCWRRTELDVVGAIGYGGTAVVNVQVVCEGPRPAAINTELQLIIVDEVVGSRKEVIGSNVAYIMNRITGFKGVAGSQRPFNFDSVVWCFDNLVRFIAGRCFWGRSVEEPVSITHPILARCFRPSNAFGVGDRILIQICHSVSSTHNFWSLLRMYELDVYPRHLEKDITIICVSDLMLGGTKGREWSQTDFKSKCLRLDNWWCMRRKAWGDYNSKGSLIIVKDSASLCQMWHWEWNEARSVRMSIKEPWIQDEGEFSDLSIES